MHFAESFVRPGGATKTGYDLCSIGARTSVVGVIGDDEMGRRLKQTLDDLHIQTDGLFVGPGRQTSTKARLLGKGAEEVQQEIVRVDRVDALLISDYENGTLSQEVIDARLPDACQRNLVVAVHSHSDLFRFTGVAVLTPN